MRTANSIVLFNKNFRLKFRKFYVPNGVSVKGGVVVGFEVEAGTRLGVYLFLKNAVLGLGMGFGLILSLTITLP